MLASVKDRPSGESEAHPGPLGEHNFAHAHERMERSGQAQELKGSYRMRVTFWGQNPAALSVLVAESDEYGVAGASI